MAARIGAIVGGVIGAGLGYFYPVDDVPLWRHVSTCALMCALAGIAMAGPRGAFTQEGCEAFAAKAASLLPSSPPILERYQAKKTAYLAKWMLSHPTAHVGEQDREWEAVQDGTGQLLADKAIVEAYVEHARANPEFAALLQTIPLQSAWLKDPFGYAIQGVSLPVLEILERARAALKVKPVDPTFVLTRSAAIRTSIASYIQDKLTRYHEDDLARAALPGEPALIQGTLFDITRLPAGAAFTVLESIIKESLLVAIDETNAWEECRSHDSVSIGVTAINGRPLEPILASILREMKASSTEMVIRPVRRRGAIASHTAIS